MSRYLISFALIISFSSVAFAFNESQLMKAMEKHQFSSSLLSTTIDIARDLKDKTGCFTTSKTHPKKTQILACEYVLKNRTHSQCHLVNLHTNKIQSGYVAFGKDGISNGPRPGSAKTALGIYTLDKTITKAKANKDLGHSFVMNIVRHDGRKSQNQFGLAYYPDTSKNFKESGGTPSVFGDFAKALLKSTKNTVLINHSQDVPYDNACGKLQARRTYSSDKGIAKVLHRSYDPSKKHQQDPMDKNTGRRMPASFSKPEFAN